MPASGHVPGSLLVEAQGAQLVRIDGDTIETVTQARADLIDAFGTPPLCVDGQGQMSLPCSGTLGLFDASGKRVDPRAQSGDTVERAGRFISIAIDSAIEACIWHRVELRGAIPPDCAIALSVTTAEIPLEPDEIDSLPDSAWTACMPARTMAPDPGALFGQCVWDALLQPPPGRYLWLRLDFKGTGRQSPCLDAALVEFPRISLRRYLPAVFGADPAGADFTDRLGAVFERTLTTIERQLDSFPLCLDPLSAPADAKPGRPDFLAWLGSWLGETLARDWPEERRRHFIKEAAASYGRLGTPGGLRQQLLLLLGFDTAYGKTCLAERPQRRCVPTPRNCAPCPPCDPAEPPPLILEHFKLRRWLYMGRGRLGADAELWGRRIVGRSELAGSSPEPGQAQLGVTALNGLPDPLHDPFLVHANKFSLFVPARIRKQDSTRRFLELLVARQTPAHVEADIRYVEPRFRVGVQAMIGLDSVIARTPLGVPLDGVRLGQGSILTGRPRTPDLAVGQARVGSTTRMT
jgi:phage tail-like protein